MEAYLGVVLKMTLVEKPDVKSYFSREWTEYYPFFLMCFLDVDFYKYIGSCMYGHLSQLLDPILVAAK